MYTSLLGTSKDTRRTRGENTAASKRLTETRDTPVVGVRHDGPGVDQVRVHDDAALRAVQGGHLDAILHRVRPEEGPPQVVDGDALWAVHVCGRGVWRVEGGVNVLNRSLPQRGYELSVRAADLI